MNSKIRVLHVDDEPVICDLTKLTLERGGKLTVDAVHSAQEALELLQTGQYSCIISDYEMPQMNGLDFLKEVRNIDKLIPFILFSGRGRETVIIDAINTGADFYIQKGGEPKALFAELNHKVDYAIQQRNTRLALKRRDSVLEAISLVSNLFLGGEPFDKAIIEATTLFGLATEVDTVRLFKLEEKSETNDNIPHFIRNVASWIRISIHKEEREEYIRTNPIQVKPELISPILNGKPLIADPSKILYLDPFRGELSAKSVAIFPVFVNQKVWGLIWFADYISERNWTGVEIDALLAASSMIGSAIQQDVMKNSLIAAKEEYASMYSLMRRLCDTVPDILWAKDNEGKFIFINQAGADFLKAPDTREPVGRSESDYPKTNITPCVSSNIYVSDHSKHILVETDSGKTDFEILSVPFTNNEGDEIGTVTLGRDITRYTTIENLLLKSKERYKSIIQSVHIGIIIVDYKGIIKTINTRALDIINETSSIEGQSLHHNPLLRELQIAETVTDVIKTGKGVSFLASQEITRTPEDLHCKVRLVVPENGEQGEVLITLDPHYTK